MIENPPLNEDLLIHFGVKGMKWGRRKKRPDEAERKKTFQNAERNRKIKIGVAVVAGAAVVGTLMTQSGRTAVTNFAATRYVQGRAAKTQAAANPVSNIVQRFKDVKASSIPKPESLVGGAANLQSQAGKLPSSAEIARRLNDPNYVWEL